MNAQLTNVLMLIFLCLLIAQLPAYAGERAFTAVKKSIPVGKVWTGSSPRFCLLTQGNKQYVGYYGADKSLTIASRSLDSEKWTYKKLDDQIGWDSHNFIAMALDSEGQLHVSGNMHCSPLVYYRTTRAGDVTSLVGVHRMTGIAEKSVTYPRFISRPKGELMFTYRDGGSGNGNNIVNIYSPKTESWSRLSEKPFMDGEGKMSAYSFNPILDRHGNYHEAWVWRDTPDVITNHDVSYARSLGGLLNWQKSDGTHIALPINAHNAEVVDPIKVGSGLMNNIQLSFDDQDRPIISYVMYDSAGKTQMYISRLEKPSWKRYLTTKWSDRWEISGMGSIGAKIAFTGPAPCQTGLYQVYTNVFLTDYTMIRFLNDKTLQPIGEPMRLYPESIDTLSSGESSEWRTNVTGFDMEELEKTGRTWVLCWKSMVPNRDMPREQVPPPSDLQLVELVRSK